jgi:hypothetical protein
VTDAHGAPHHAAPASVRGGARLSIPAPVLGQLEAHGLPVAGVLDAVEDRLHEQVASSHAFVDEVARYLISAGGKRFRPLMVALTGHLGDPSRRELVDAGVIVELVHLATLYHDDVIDEAPARRGTPSANSRWDNTVAILTGDYLFARASDLSADLGVEVTRIMARTLAQLCEGQIREVQGSMGALPPDVPAIDPTLEHYLEVISGKTASLIATSCRYGALLSAVSIPTGSRRRPRTAGTSGWPSSSPTTSSTSPPTTRTPARPRAPTCGRVCGPCPSSTPSRRTPTASSPPCSPATSTTPTWRARSSCCGGRTRSSGHEPLRPATSTRPAGNSSRSVSVRS